MIIESCRSVHPQEQRLPFAEALPPVHPRTLEIQTVTRLQRVIFHLIEPENSIPHWHVGGMTARSRCSSPWGSRSSFARASPLSGGTSPLQTRHSFSAKTLIYSCSVGCYPQSTLH